MGRNRPIRHRGKDGLGEMAAKPIRWSGCWNSVVCRGRGWPHALRRSPYVLAPFVLCFLFQLVSDAEIKPVRRILILNEVGPSFPIINLIDQGIRSGLDNAPYKLEFYHEYLETLLFPDAADQKQFREFYIRKYENRRPDLIITVGPAPLRFMLDAHKEFFPGVPVIFCLPNGLVPGGPAVDSDFTGVDTDFAAEETVRAALRLQPDTEHVIVVGGVANYDRQREAIVKQQLKTYEEHLDISYLTDLAMPALLERLKHLPKNTVVLMTAIGQDAAGTRFTSSETGPMISAAANAPVFSLADVYLGHGEVGGDLADLTGQGKAVAGLSLRILRGEKPHDIPPVRGVDSYKFDWRALRRWGFRERDLPPGSIVVFRELSIWERTRWVWISALLVILFLAAVATYLQYSRTQLKLARDAQSQLSGLLINAQEQERRRLASELHDDFSQRVALLVFGLGEVQDTVPNLSNGVKQKLQHLMESASELGDDLHTISHRLHSSTLDALGLVRGLNALCRDFTAGQNIEIDFSSQDVPTHVQPDVALCLFRIVQEALQNLKKHSGAARAQVNLRRTGNILFLFIHDEGKGVDVSQLNQKIGLGIGSMRGRAQLLGGQFEIHSEPGKGTTIEVWVPLEAELTPTTSTA